MSPFQESNTSAIFQLHLVSIILGHNPILISELRQLSSDGQPWGGETQILDTCK